MQFVQFAQFLPSVISEVVSSPYIWNKFSRNATPGSAPVLGLGHLAPIRTQYKMPPQAEHFTNNPPVSDRGHQLRYLYGIDIPKSPQFLNYRTWPMTYRGDAPPAVIKNWAN